MKISVDLTELGLEYDHDGDVVGQRTFRGAVETRAARILLEELSSAERYEMGKRVRELRDEEIRAAIRVHIADAMAEPIVRSTPWGEAKGEPISIRELIREELEKFLSAKASTRDSYNRNDGPSSLGQMIAEQTRDVMTKELMESVKAAKAEIKDAVHGKALAAAVAVLSEVR